MNLSADQLQLLRDLDAKSVLLPDIYVRDKYEYRPQNGGIPNPHICELATDPLHLPSPSYYSPLRPPSTKS